MTVFLKTKFGNPTKNQYVNERNGVYTFTSYQTKIAVYDGIWLMVNKEWDYSKTTLYYFKQFVNEFTGFEYQSKSQFLKLAENVETIIVYCENSKILQAYPAKKTYVTMTDKFLSGWGMSKGKINKLIFICDSIKQAQIVAKNALARSDMKYINITQRKPYYNVKRYYAQVKTIDNYPNWYVVGYFNN